MGRRRWGLPLRVAGAGLVFWLAAGCRTAPREAVPAAHPSPALAPAELAAIPEGTPAMSAQEARRRSAFGEALLVVDVRGPEERAGGRIPGSLHLPYYELQTRQAELPRDRAVVLYCGGGDCPLSRWSAHKLAGWGYKNVYEMTGGIEAWRAAGYPTEDGPER